MGWEVFSFLSVFLNLGKLFLNCINIMCREKEMKELESQVWRQKAVELSFEIVTVEYKQLPFKIVTMEYKGLASKIVTV